MINMPVWLPILTACIGLMAGLIIGSRTRELTEDRDHYRNDATRYRNQLTTAQQENLALMQRARAAEGQVTELRDRYEWGWTDTT